MRAKIMSESHLRKDSLSLNCLKSSVWSARISVMARSNALSCSIRAFLLIGIGDGVLVGPVAGNLLG